MNKVFVFGFFGRKPRGSMTREADFSPAAEASKEKGRRNFS
jgi:hypothetical protein